MFRVVLLGSGRGSNAEAILQAEQEGQLGRARVVGILSDCKEARILKLGKRFSVPAKYLHPGKFNTKLSNQAEQNWIETIVDLQVDLIVLAGFMRVLKAPFLQTFSGKIINLHPSLLPKYPGLHAIKRAYEAGDKESGCTVHWVNEILDGGEIIAQSVVEIMEDDSLEKLEEGIHSAEHKLLPRIVKAIANNEKLN